jgi:hypothetical protein
LILRHLARSHFELSVRAFGDIAYDLNVVGLVGENEPSDFLLVHQTV